MNFFGLKPGLIAHSVQLSTVLGALVLFPGVSLIANVTQTTVSLPIVRLPATVGAELSSGDTLQRFRVERDVVYATPDGIPLRLNLLVPLTGGGPFPLIIWLHGGGWHHGSYVPCPPVGWQRSDYVIASVEYRLSGAAKFPAQIIDCKAAVRWLRANQARYKIDGNRIGVWGESAGGRLAAMLGTTGSTKCFDSGGNLDVASDVQAVCDFYGPTDLLAWGKTTASEPTLLKDFLGGMILDVPEATIAASPLSHVGPAMPPFLIVHGDRDRAVPIAQSEILRDALWRTKTDVKLHVVSEAGHGGEKFRTQEIEDMVQAFFDQHLKRL